MIAGKSRGEGEKENGSEEDRPGGRRHGKKEGGKPPREGGCLGRPSEKTARKRSEKRKANDEREPLKVRGQRRATKTFSDIQN